jgi:hypothetical protein
MSRKLLVIGAHSADFVWRAAGTIALVTSQGGSAEVVALSYGERGESGVLWKEPNQTVENVKRIMPPELYYFEPHQPELCQFTPNTFIETGPTNTPFSSRFSSTCTNPAATASRS